MKLFLSLFLLLCTSSFSSGFAPTLHNVFTIGPVFNWHFGNNQNFTSYGFNAYYWDFTPASQLPKSIGIGYEQASDKSNIFFAEVQSGVLFFGASSGIVYSDQKGLGFQASTWGNVFAGYNIRYRFFNNPEAKRLHYFTPGLYLSIPYLN